MFLLGHRSPAQPWPGPLVFFGPLAQADKDFCLCLAGRKGPGVRTVPCVWCTRTRGVSAALGTFHSSMWREPQTLPVGEPGEAVFTRTQLRLLQGEYLISKPDRSNAAGGWSCVSSLALSRNLNSRTNYLIMVLVFFFFLLCFFPIPSIREL